MKRVFTKKCLEFRNRETGETTCTRPLEFCELPDWAIHDPLYQWAKADGDLEEIGKEKGSKKKEELNNNGEAAE